MAPMMINAMMEDRDEEKEARKDIEDAVNELTLAAVKPMMII